MKAESCLSMKPLKVSKKDLHFSSTYQSFLPWLAPAREGFFVN